MLVRMTMSTVGQHRIEKSFLALVVRILLNELVFDFGVAIQAFGPLLFDVNFVIFGDQVEREWFLPIDKKLWLIVTTLAIAARHGRVLAGGIGMASDALHLSCHDFRVIHLYKLCGKV